jgi:hypothetical protein
MAITKPKMDLFNSDVSIFIDSLIDVIFYGTHRPPTYLFTNDNVQKGIPGKMTPVSPPHRGSWGLDRGSTTH